MGKSVVSLSCHFYPVILFNRSACLMISPPWIWFASIIGNGGAPGTGTAPASWACTWWLWWWWCPLSQRLWIWFCGLAAHLSQKLVGIHSISDRAVKSIMRKREEIRRIIDFKLTGDAWPDVVRPRRKNMEKLKQLKYKYLPVLGPNFTSWELEQIGLSLNQKYI